MDNQGGRLLTDYLHPDYQPDRVFIFDSILTFFKLPVKLDISYGATTTTIAIPALNVLLTNI